jgi:hypothetical protein
MGLLLVLLFQHPLGHFEPVFKMTQRVPILIGTRSVILNTGSKWQ